MRFLLPIISLSLLLSSCRFSDRGKKQRENSSPPVQDTFENSDSNSKNIVFDSLSPDSKPTLPPGLKDFQDVFADVAEKAIPAVVSIYSERNIANPESGSPFDDFLDRGPFRYFYGDPNNKQTSPREHLETGLGSGVIISSSGYILTNYHVIQGADVIKVQLLDDTEYPGVIVGADKPSDIAVIKITVKDQILKTLPMGNSDKLRIGEWILAVGNPYGLSHTVTTGIISAKGRKNTGINSYENFLQTDAAINPGNSGGALLNLSGELIGINTAIFSRTGGYQGIGFAIPINMAKKITQDLIRDGIVTRGWLGVSTQPNTPDITKHNPNRDSKSDRKVKGAMVGAIVPESPAEKSGIRVGDIIFKIGNLEIRDANDLLNRIAILVPNEWVEIWVIRDDAALSFKTLIAKRDEKRLANYQGQETPPSSQVGLQVADMTEEFKDRFSLDKTLNFGVVILSVETESRAANAKLQVGDVLLEVNRVPIQSLDSYRTSMRQAIKGNKILIKLSRHGTTLFTTL